jgi:tetratricopeptide (TPR) repeat protein
MNNLRGALEQALQFHQSGNLKQAESLYGEILQQHPGHPDALNLLGVMANQIGQPEVAIDLIRQAVVQLPHEADFHGNLAAAYQAAGRVPDAVRHYREAIRLNPAAVNQYLFLSDALQEQGELEEALAHSLHALRLNPDSALAYCTLGELAGHGCYTLTDADIQHVQDLLDAGSQTPQDASLLYFTLAAHWERIGCYDLAFPCYCRANALKQQVYRQANQSFDADKHRALIDSLIAVFTPSFLQQVRTFGIDSEVPVFVVGLVRSGTSLVEQILASHPQVHGAGERKEIDKLANSLSVANGGVVSDEWLPSTRHHSPLTTHQAPRTTDLRYPGCVQHLEPGTARSLAYGYLQRLARQAGAASRIVDKMPHNYLHLGLIAMLFPRAHIIHCRREPLDVCASAYFQNFKWMPHAASLEDIAFHHCQYERLMEHWRRVLPVTVHEVVYEELVADPPAVSRALVAACGLDWDERCLSFYRTDRVVQTASKLQVRRPIYTGSVGRGKAFQAHLDPLRRALGIPERSRHTGQKVAHLTCETEPVAVRSGS